VDKVKRYIPHYLLIIAILILTPILVNAIAPEYTELSHVVERVPQLPAISDKPAEEIEPPARDAYPLTTEERDVIALIVAGEARGEEPTGKCAVADVILNRLLDGRFGCTVEEVCNAGQFHGFRYKGEIPQDCYDAVDLVFKDGNTGWSCSALYFCTGNPDAIKPGLRETVRIGAHGFYTDKEDKP
jgi:hypothetical protein